jgi:hypothetical protein
MRTFLVGLIVATGVLLGGLLFEQLIVEGTLGPAAMLGAALLGTVLLALVATLLLSRTRHRVLVGNVWLATCSVAVTYLILDLAAGWILIRPLSPPLVPDQVVHHRLVPDSYAEFQQRDFSYLQRVNKHGLRGQEFATEKAPGTYRVVMLGDSFTMGKGVEDDQTFSVLVERFVNEKKGPRCKTMEVLNGGVDSYAPILSFLQLKRDLQPLHPDLVVLNLDVSDLVQEAAYRTQAVRGPDGEVVGVPQHAQSESPVERIRVWTERHMFFTRVLLLYANKALGYRELTVRDVVTRANVETVAHTLTGDVDRTKQWHDIFESLANMKAYCREHGIEFLLTVYPWAHEISDTEWVPGRYAFMPHDAKASHSRMRTIQELAAANEMPLLDVTPTFQGYRGTEPLYFKYDMHWTTTGHQVMAQALGEYLTQKHTTWCE